MITGKVRAPFIPKTLLRRVSRSAIPTQVYTSYLNSAEYADVRYRDSVSHKLTSLHPNRFVTLVLNLIFIFMKINQNVYLDVAIDAIEIEWTLNYPIEACIIVSYTIYLTCWFSSPQILNILDQWKRICALHVRHIIGVIIIPKVILKLHIILFHRTTQCCNILAISFTHSERYNNNAHFRNTRHYYYTIRYLYLPTHRLIRKIVSNAGPLSLIMPANCEPFNKRSSTHSQT